MADPLTRPELLLHDDFVRGLARALLGADGEDVAQQAWLRALKALPPRGDVRAFWATIVRRLAWNRVRDDRRRSAREAAMPAPVPGPSPAEVLEREEARRRVVAAVLALDEPFREVVLLRFYDDLQPAAIAQRLALPGSTVRTRLLRALGKLRAALDEAPGGRKAWAAPLLPWLGTRSAVGLPAVVILMKKVLVVAAVAAFLLFGMLMLQSSAPLLPESHVTAAIGTAADAATSEHEADGTPPQDTAAAERTSVAASELSLDGRYPADRRLARLHGFVVDFGGSAARGVEVTARPWLNRLPAGLQITDDRDYRFTTRTDAGGAFAFDGVVEGPCEIVARAADGREGRAIMAASASRHNEVIWIQLRSYAEPDEVVVEVIDRERRPLPGVRVVGCVLSATNGLCDGRAHPEVTASTDAHGLARFRNQRFACGMFFARTDDGRSGMHQAFGGYPWWLTITVDAPGGVRGRLLGGSADTLAGTKVLLHAASGTDPYGKSVGRSIAVDLRGDTFAADGLVAGIYGVTLDSPSGMRLELEPGRWPRTLAMRTVTVAAGETAQLDLRVTRGACVCGIVVDEAGPVAGARVMAACTDPNDMYEGGVRSWRLDSEFEDAPRNPQGHVVAVTAADGRYELQGLQPGSHDLEVTAPGRAIDRRALSVSDGETPELRHELAPAGVLEVAARGPYIILGVAPSGRPEQPFAIASCRGIATFPGLPAGTCSVFGYSWKPRLPPRLLADVTITAGRTTSLDLRDRGDSMTVAGRVLAGGTPVAGALVEYHDARARTDADGRFTLELGFRVKLSGLPAHSASLRVYDDAVRHRFAPPASAHDSPRVDVDLDLGECALAVRALDAGGMPVAAGVEVYQDEEKRHEHHALVALHMDSLSLRNVPAGGTQLQHLTAADYTVVADFPSGAQTRTRCTVPRREPLVLREPAYGYVLVTVVADGRTVANRKIILREWQGDGAAPADARAFWNNASWREAVTDERGNVCFAGVRAGDVLVWIYEDEVPEQRVRVEPGVEAVVRLHSR